MKLRELLAQVASIQPPIDNPTLELEVTGLCTNSHACQQGDLFIGMPGTRVDGGEFWHSAIASGAIAALVTPSAAASRARSRASRSTRRYAAATAKPTTTSASPTPPAPAS